MGSRWWWSVALALVGCQAGPGPEVVVPVGRPRVDRARPSAAPVTSPSASSVLPGAGLADGVFLRGAGGQPLIGLDGGSLVRLAGSGGALVGPDAGTLIGPDGATLIGSDAGTVITPKGRSGLNPAPARPGGVSSIESSEDPPPAELAPRDTLVPPSGLPAVQTVYLADAVGRLLLRSDGRPIEGTVSEGGAFQVSGLQVGPALCYMAPFGVEAGKPYGLLGLRPQGAAVVRVDAASTLLVTWLRARPGWDQAALKRVPAEAWQRAQDAVRDALLADLARLPQGWQPAPVLAAMEALVAAKPALGPLREALWGPAPAVQPSP